MLIRNYNLSVILDPNRLIYLDVPGQNNPPDLAPAFKQGIGRLKDLIQRKKEKKETVKNEEQNEQVNNLERGIDTELTETGVKAKETGDKFANLRVKAEEWRNASDARRQEAFSYLPGGKNADNTELARVENRQNTPSEAVVNSEPARDESNDAERPVNYKEGKAVFEKYIALRDSYKNELSDPRFGYTRSAINTMAKQYAEQDITTMDPNALALMSAYVEHEANTRQVIVDANGKILPDETELLRQNQRMAQAKKDKNTPRG